MNSPAATPQWILALIATFASLYWLRDFLAPFALALILWLAIDSFAAYLKRRATLLAPSAALVLALAVVLGSGALAIFVLAQSAAGVAAEAAKVGPRFDALARELQVFGEAPQHGVCYLSEPHEHLTLGPDARLRTLPDGFYRAHNIDALFLRSRSMQESVRLASCFQAFSRTARSVFAA